MYGALREGPARQARCRRQVHIHPQERRFLLNRGQECASPLGCTCETAVSISRAPESSALPPNVLMMPFGHGLARCAVQACVAWATGRALMLNCIQSALAGELRHSKEVIACT